MNCTLGLLTSLAIAAAVTSCMSGYAQTNNCSSGYRSLSRHYDAELHKIWELRQSCLHPEWPAHSVLVNADSAPLLGNMPIHQSIPVGNVQPILVRAGEPVRLWSQDRSSRIEITGIAEQSARLGDHVNVRVTYPSSGDNPAAIQHLAGIVRAAADVEMAQ